MGSRALTSAGRRVLCSDGKRPKRCTPTGYVKLVPCMCSVDYDLFITMAQASTHDGKVLKWHDPIGDLDMCYTIDKTQPPVAPEALPGGIILDTDDYTLYDDCDTPCPGNDCTDEGKILYAVEAQQDWPQCNDGGTGATCFPGGLNSYQDGQIVLSDPAVGVLVTTPVVGPTTNAWPVPFPPDPVGSESPRLPRQVFNTFRTLDIATVISNAVGPGFGFAWIITVVNYGTRPISVNGDIIDCCSGRNYTGDGPMGFELVIGAA